MKQYWYVIIIILIILSNIYFFVVNRQLQNEYSYIEDEKEELEFKIEQLEDELDEIKSDYSQTLDDYQEHLSNAKLSIGSIGNNYSSSLTENDSDKSSNEVQYYRNTQRSFKTNYIMVYNDLQLKNFDAGIIISPTFSNLHKLLNVSQSEFEKLMKINDYSLTTTRDSFVSNSTASCCFTIDKESDSIVMFFTQGIENDLEVVLRNNEIDFTYEEGFKRYFYTHNDQRYTLDKKESSNHLILLLRKIY